MYGKTLTETVHGNPGENRKLPEGLVVFLKPADNLPADSSIKYWAYPALGHPWPPATEVWADTVGVGLKAEDVKVDDPHEIAHHAVTGE